MGVLVPRPDFDVEYEGHGYHRALMFRQYCARDYDETCLGNITSLLSSKLSKEFVSFSVIYPRFVVYMIHNRFKMATWF